jgi:uncharacterized membrane protein YczE
MSKSISIALRTTTERHSMLIAALICAVLNAVLIDALIAIAMHYQSFMVLAVTVAINTVIVATIALYWYAHDHH